MYTVQVHCTSGCSTSSCATYARLRCICVYVVFEMLIPSSLQRGRIPLSVASSEGHANIVQMLVDAHADVNSMTSVIWEENIYVVLLMWNDVLVFTLSLFVACNSTHHIIIHVSLFTREGEKYMTLYKFLLYVHTGWLYSSVLGCWVWPGGGSPAAAEPTCWHQPLWRGIHSP